MSAENSTTPRGSARRAAVIDVGTTSIRMSIADIDEQGGVHLKTHLSQAVQLGRDTFSTLTIDRATIEDCVRALKAYKKILTEWQIDRPEQLRVVATSAVREARNQIDFLDRIYTATGIEVVPIDEAEVSRMTYLGIQPLLKHDPELNAARTAIVEVGGGSTELLVVQKGDVQFSHTYRLGSLRLKEQFDHFRTGEADTRHLLELHVRRQVQQIRQQLPVDSPTAMVAIGGDARFAMQQILGKQPEFQTSGRISLREFDELTNTVLSLSADKVVHKYKISFADADTVGCALLAYSELARELGIETIVVASANLRDGLLQEMADRGVWNEDFAKQVMRSAVDLGRRFHFHEAHALHVAKLCKILFQRLREEHRLPPKYELLLSIAATLHEIGMFVSTGSYHKHTEYLIRNSELFGLSREDVTLAALTARYHRRASPQPTHRAYALLRRDQRIAVVKMAALLRIAIALNASRNQLFQELDLKREGGRLVIIAPGGEDLSMEQLALKQSGSLFTSTYGMPVLLRKLRG